MKEIAIALINNLPSIIASVGVIVLSIMGLRLNKKVDQVNSNVNGKMELLMQTKGAAEFSKGEAAGRQAGIVERADRLTITEAAQDREDQRQARTEGT